MTTHTLHDGAGLAGIGRIGPNAILQVLVALSDAVGEPAARALMAHAGLQGHVDDPPTAMVDERDVQVLHRTLRRELGIDRARAIGRHAGLLTGDYLLAHRIPAPARLMLPRLPAAWASQALMLAVRQHAWTFCGSGVFAVRPGTPLRVSISSTATARGTQADEPLCDYFAATFERLFQVLVHPATEVRELECTAMGAAACVFEIRWR
ncbi:MAG: bacteriochlorophyll 4-vinyl reductase [Rubrivivax sp.]